MSRSKHSVVYLATVGSNAYGTNLPTSDIDVRGIFFPDKRTLYSPFKGPTTYEGEGLVDGVKDVALFEIRFFLGLLQAQNPNILELLWVDERFIRKFSPEFGILKKNRQRMLSKACVKAFIGYADSQLGRIKGHNKWINNPQPARRPKEIDFLTILWNFALDKEWNNKIPMTGYKVISMGGTNYGLVPGEATDCIHDKHEALVINDDPALRKQADIKMMFSFRKEDYQQAVTRWKQYWEWKKNRNEVRSQLEEKYGFDTKHGMHLIRLLRMGEEVLKYGEVRVWRDDAQSLLNIRNGLVPYERLLEEAEDLRGRIKGLEVRSELPEVVDPELVKDISLELHESFWKSQN